jgi:hypothetical protein
MPNDGIIIILLVNLLLVWQKKIQKLI